MLHGDLIGSAGAASDEGQVIESRSAYTAFGERVSLGGSPPPQVDSRYRYAGEWGYEEGLLRLDGASGTAPIVLAHVGERWYDPGTGRFVQRDPIGVMGGLNVYLYCEATPSVLVDPADEASIPGMFKDMFFPIVEKGHWMRDFVFGPFSPRFGDGVLRLGPVLDKATNSTVQRLAWLGKRGGWPWRAGHMTVRTVGGTTLGLCMLAYSAGDLTAQGINWATRKVTGRSLSDRIGDWLVPPVYYIPP